MLTRVLAGCFALSVLSLSAHAEFLTPVIPGAQRATGLPTYVEQARTATAPRTAVDVEKGLAGGELPHFRRVSENLLRGGRPTDVGMLRLKEAGVRTIVNLENDMNAVQQEMTSARELGLVEISSPMRSLYAPPDAQVDEILALLQDKRNFPIYLHCKHGEDRTGLIMGLYRVVVDHWSPEEAYREMREYGFHPILWNLDRYFKNRVATIKH